MLSCSVWFSAPSFWMGGGLECCCVGRVYSADGAVQHHPQVAAYGFLHRVFGWVVVSRAAAKVMFTVRMVPCSTAP